MQLWREGTQKQYSVYLWKWDEFCVQRQINSVQTSVWVFFLHDLFTKGLSYSAVNSASSALSNYFMGENLSNSEFSVVSHPLIKRYMKGYVCTGQTLKVQRCQTLTNLDISSMKKTVRFYLYQFKNRMKQKRPGHSHLFLRS